MIALLSRRQFLATSAGALVLAPAETFRMGRLDHDSFKQNSAAARRIGGCD